MDKPRRDNLRTVIGRARRLVEDSVSSQLAAFGLFRDAPPVPREQLALRPGQEPEYLRIMDAVRREARAVGKGSEVGPEAVTRFVRETGATWVNRLAALRALETRHLLDPAAAFVSDEYGGVSSRAIRMREATAQRGVLVTQDEALRRGIEDACQELSGSVRVLFDLSDEQSLIWPDAIALRSILRLFSIDVSVEDWSQTDVLGWVYQYYNTEANAELKRRKNRTTGFKYRPDDIPIANQFYTPHWVVRVLTDNTLGRLWLEMQGRLPQLEQSEEVEDGRTVVRYRLVERRLGVPHAASDAEAFKVWIAEEADGHRDGRVDRLCRFLVPLPSSPPPRGKKSVREIRVLDLACGSGHFLLYAFDVLFAMYREAEPDLDPRGIPALILEHNLFGIDIDLRAAQLAAFNLYLKARATLATIDPKAQLQLRGLNIVVADAHIGDDPRREAFLNRYKADPEIRVLYRKILSDLDHTNALGSLIKVRTEFETLFGRIRQARQPSAGTRADNWPEPRQGLLIDISPQLDLRSAYRSTSGRTWSIKELLDELRAFEAEVAPSQDVGARLFYSDLQRSVGLLQLLSLQYDIVLMNPPYGDMPPETKDYLAGNPRKKVPAHYPRSGQYYETAFMEQAIDVLQPDGLVGALVKRSFMNLSSFAVMRKEVLAREAVPELLQDYGLGILDGATVRTVGVVIRKNVDQAADLDHRATFHRLAYYPTALKPEQFLSSLPDVVAHGPDPELDWFVARLRSLSDIPGMPYAYWATDPLRSLFRKHPVLDIEKVLSPEGLRTEKRGNVKQGIATQDDARFIRLWWEIGQRPTSIPRGWRWYAKGGANVFFYTRIDLLVDWRNEGEAIRRWIEDGLGDHPSRHLRNLDFQGREGLTWRAVAWTTRRFGYVQAGAMFSNRGSMIFLDEPALMPGLGFLNSKLAAALVLSQTTEREWHLSEIAALPFPDCMRSWSTPAVSMLLRNSWILHTGDETCADFVCPDLLELFRKIQTPLDIGQLLEAWVAGRKCLADEEACMLNEIDGEVYRLYEISLQDQVLIERELARRPKSESGYSTAELNGNGGGDGDAEREGDDPQEGEDSVPRGARPLQETCAELSPARARDLTARWISIYLKQTIEGDKEGVVPIDAMHGRPALAIRLRESMEAHLGGEAAQALCNQAPMYLGTRDLTEWVAISLEETASVRNNKQRLPVGFFPWHVAIYRNRPIFWLVSSENFEQGKTRLIFRAYLHYHRITSDTLPRLVTHYLNPTIETAEREWRLAREEASGITGRPQSAANAKAEEWLRTVDALRQFRSAVERVIQGPVEAEKVPERAKWLPRTIAEVRGGQDVGHGYRPNVDYGVRVNIAPLVEQRLLPRVVLKRLGG